MVELILRVSILLIQLINILLKFPNSRIARQLHVGFTSSRLQLHKQVLCAPFYHDEQL